MQMTMDPLTLKLKYATVRKDTGNIVYKRPVPKALQQHFTAQIFRENTQQKTRRSGFPCVTKAEAIRRLLQRYAATLH